MKNKKLKLIVILALVIQMVLPAGMLAYHYSIYNYALNNTPDFKFYLSYFDLYSYGDNDEIIYDDEDKNDVLYFDIAYRYYREDMFVTVDENGFAKISNAQNKKNNKHWFSYDNYNKIGSYSQSEGEFAYVDTEEAKKVMSQWKDTYFDHYGDDEIRFKGGNAVYITAKVYKGMFIPTAVYRDNVKVIEISTKR
jgi:hypothetical protein